ncbi:hypothetical protein [Streptomyces sp. WG5]|uniref:hypothetical protein n=1 Tax=Streptomyces sp. WG5 TaxID=3417648 RepID=UPI003CE92B8A
MVECLSDALAAWSLLQSADVAVGTARADIRVNGEDGSELFCLRDVRVTSPESRVVGGVLRSWPAVHYAEIAEAVTVDLSVPGTCLRNGEEREVEKLFLVSVDAWITGARTISLRTFADAWMSHDLRGRRQPVVQAENAPRLEVTLSGLARLTGAETVPGDPTLYGIPDKHGFTDLPDEDPDLLDSWYMFEVPRRTEALRRGLPSGGASLGEPDYASAVKYMDVVLRGRVIGYMWAASDDSAAGYEPYAPRGDVALDAAVIWLSRLSDARERGAVPSDALREMAMMSDGASAGIVVADSLKEADSLEYVQELSGCE